MSRGPGRPEREPHPIEEILARQLRPNTVVSYGQIAKRIEASGMKAREWLDHLISEKASAAKAENIPALGMPKRTLGQYRTAVAYYVSLIEEPGTARLSVSRELPQARALRDGQLRDALTPAQVEVYRRQAEGSPEPYRTILLLLLLTGCRVSEVCLLERDKVDAARRSITVHGKGAKTRTIPLGEEGWSLLSTYLAGARPLGAYAFMLEETIRGNLIENPRPCWPRDVWRVVADWEAYQKGGILEHLSIHQTRHTAATRMMKRGKSLKVIQDTLGHQSMKSLERYLHTDDEQRLDAVRSLEGE